MECVTIANSESVSAQEENKKVEQSDSAENFQHIIYDLFEKNGILGDLRAYLRGHIVELLKNAPTGGQPTCQKHFTQRLELSNQALNMLVAEYLLRYEFSYSLSVFVSEIPLANMVFGFAKAFMLNGDKGDCCKLWFSENDVWSVLNYLGIKCDSEHANNIIEKYRKKEAPLLWCILSSVPFYCKQDTLFDKRNSSMESLASDKSSDSVLENTNCQKGHRQEKCKHYAFCKLCQSRLRGAKEKYAKKKKNLSKTPVQTVNPNVETENLHDLLNNVSHTEKALIDEMFHQLRNVYEAEVEMVKMQEEKKYKQVLSTYAEQLQRRQSEMEQSYKQRETDLESTVQQKKKFLWGLAQALRDQHQNMAAAMDCVKGESERLSAKENNLKSQLQQAENIIRKRGEDMRAQISREIVILEGHLETMRKERDTIDKEKSELENFKALCENRIKIIKDDTHFETLKKEILSLKKYVEEKRCVAEKCTMTDCDGGRMNNQDFGKSDSEERVGRAPNQVVNDLKKLKNVNFKQPQIDVTRQESRRARSLSTEGFEEQTRRDAILVLQDENERLKHFARQQELHIDELNIQTARLQAELEATRVRSERPRTAPTMPANYECYEPRVNTSYSATHNAPPRRRGAGEQLLCGARAARGGGAGHRRYLIQQWRALRNASPSAARQTEPQPDREPYVTTTVAENAPNDSNAVDTEPMRGMPDESDFPNTLAYQYENAQQAMPAVNTESKPRSKSPKTVLKEAKQKLRNKDSPRNPPQFKREKSPNSVLREAKLRLRKLEIEAEAVEKSYLDFRKRQTKREERKSHFMRAKNPASAAIDKVRSRSLMNIREESQNGNTNDILKCKQELDKFLSIYQNKFNIADSLKSAKAKAKVIPQTIIDIDKENVRKENTYLETPLNEFRKLYSQKTRPSYAEKKKVKDMKEEIRSKNKDEIRPKSKDVSESENKNDVKPRGSPNIRNDSAKCDNKELQIFEDNIDKIYSLHENKIELDKSKSESQMSDKNVLRIEVERVVAEANDLELKESSQDLLLVVQSSADARDVSSSEIEAPSPQMTIVISPKFLKEESETSQYQPSNVPVCLEEPEKLTVTKDMNTILHADTVPAVPVAEDGSQGIESGSEKADDYVDDFSADVDNYNSRSEYNNSPVSHVKTSEDENFWD